MTKDVLQQALEALERYQRKRQDFDTFSDTITALQEALAQPVQPQRPWVGLTDTERNEIWKKEVGWGDPSHDDEDLMKAIERTLKEKNT